MTALMNVFEARFVTCILLSILSMGAVGSFEARPNSGRQEPRARGDLRELPWRCINTKCPALNRWSGDAVWQDI